MNLSGVGAIAVGTLIFNLTLIHKYKLGPFKNSLRNYVFIISMWALAWLWIPIAFLAD